MCQLCSFHDVVSGMFFLLRNQDFLPWSLPFGQTSARLALKLEADRLSLREKLTDINPKDAEIRLKLMKNDGHKGKVNKKVLDWMDHADKLLLESMTQLGDSVPQGCCRYVYLKADRSLLKLIYEVDILLENTPSLMIYEHVPVKSRTDFVPNVAPKVFEEIWNSLTDPRIGIIGLYGYGGVGKTTIMKNIVNQLELANTETFDNIIWVTLSKNVNWERVRDDIAMQLSIGKDLRNVDRSLIMSEHLRNMKRGLFIIDDMWKPTRPYDEDVWKPAIRQFFRRTIFPEPTEDNGCKVVITTRDQSVCEVVGASKQIYLAPLSQNEAWELFVSRCGDHVLDPNIQGIAREVACQCDGLPLNIITIAHAMRGKSNEYAWRKALRGYRYDKFYHLKFCFKRLKNDQTRKCFLYCGVFPENYKFKSKELIEYWMAEDYIFIKGDLVGSINMGKEILRELKDANMLEMFVEDGNECFKIHGLFRDLAIRIAMKEYNFMVEAGQRLTEVGDAYIKENDRDAKLISVIRNDIKAFDEPPWSWSVRVNKCPSLSTLLLRDNPLAHIYSGFFRGLPNLEFLDMSYTVITELPLSLCELEKLRVLFLGYCTCLKKIPSLEKLKELQVLNLCGTLIKELPEGMKCLSKLRSLDLSETVRLEDIQDGALSSLSNLEELHMQGSRICKIDSLIVAARLMEIRCLKKLSILTLSAVGFGNHLDTILYLQGYNLKVYSINSYGTNQDYVEDI